MNSIQNNKVLTKQVKYSKGVYPIDLLLSPLKKPSIIVINFNTHYMPVSLWVTVCFSDSGYAEYFDSYGLPPYTLEIMAYLQRHSISWTFNRHRQALTSNICGHYCCIYALHRARGLTMTSFVNIFISSRYTCNDIRAVRMFRAKIGECPTCSPLEQQQSCKSQIYIKVRILAIISLHRLSS